MMRVAIIGGGLAGAACAYIMKERGVHPVVYEAGPEIAPGASGNSLGLYNPRITAEKTPISDFYGFAFFESLKVFRGLEGIDWNACGALHLISDEKRAVRYQKTIQNWDWPDGELALLDRFRASEVAGIALDYGGLYLRSSGFVSPQKLCVAYLQGVEVRVSTPIANLQELDADVVILACGMGALNFQGAAHLPLKPVRGQITQIEANEQTQALKCNLCYGGYVSASLDGHHIVGSTFQRWLDHDDIIEADDADNLGKLAAHVPALGSEFKVSGHRAAVRVAAKDHCPVIGKLGEAIYVSTAHGSHGVLSSLAGAYILSDMILQENTTLPREVLDVVCPARFKMRSR